MKSIGVVGGGVIGLTTAEAILEDYPGLQIVVYSDKYSPYTTGDVAAGLIRPSFYGGKYDAYTVKKWVNATVKHVIKFARENSEASEAICLLSGYKLWKTAPKKPESFQDCYFGWRDVEKSEIDTFSVGGRYCNGAFLTTWQCDCSLYLPLVMKKLADKGVQFVQKKIQSLDEVAGFGHDIVVNTAGFNAKYLTGDNEVQPLKGQILIVKAPWVKHFYREGDGDSYIYPKSDYLVVGGTHDRDSSLTIDQSKSKKIWEDACKMLPALRNGKVIGERVGIRPGRPSIRMEIEQRKTNNGKDYTVLHHYGHGGYGVSVHWGCAKEASSMLKSHLPASSKL